MKNRNVSPALCRLLGFIGSMAGGLVFFHIVNSGFGIGVEVVGFSPLGGKGWLLLAVSVVVGLFSWLLAGLSE